MNTATKLTNATEVLETQQKLEIVKGKKPLPKSFLEAKAQLKKRRTPGIIYNSLSQHQKNIIVFAAGGFRPCDANKSFNDFTMDQRIKIQHALILLSQTFCAFSKANAMQLSMFAEIKPKPVTH